MLGRLLRPRPHTAAAVLRRVFGRVPASFAFRLWDGTEVRFGSDRAVCVVAIKSQEIFVALMRDPSPGHFAEAYASGAIDLEGDLYKTMHVANAVEGIKLSAGEKLRIAVAMLPGVSAVMGGHDAIVVGGGPGGSTAAWQLAQAGLRPLVLDAAVFPRVKLCAGWVTAAALADVEIDPEKYPLTIQPFSVCAVAFEGARHETRWRRPASFGIIRREFDHYLLERAAAAGADVRWGVRVQAVTADAGGAAVETEQGRFEAPLVIGAGGHRCPVARDLGEISGREEVVVAQESETRLPPERVASLGRFMDAPELYVEPDLRGYGWYFPKQDFLNIGIGCTGGADAGLRERRDALVAALRASGRLPADLPLEPFKGHAYVVRRQAPRRLVGPRFCLVGDAAGLARDLSGEGIGPAIRSGRLAAAAVRALLRDGTSLAGYAREIVALYGPGEPGWLARQIGKLPDAVARAAVRVILGSGAARRRVVFGSIFGMREAAS